MIRCPVCNESYYEECYTTATAMYYPPIYKNGININPDKNIRTTTCKCLNCRHMFFIVERGGEVKIEPGEEYKDVPVINTPINTGAYDSTITTKMSNLTATIKDSTLERIEQAIQELKSDMTEIKRAL